MDVDRFKVINDSRGHSVGDELLRAIAGRLLATVRPTDTVARFGGDEFVIVTESGEPGYSPATLSQRIASALAQPVALDDTEVIVTVSMGVAVAGLGDNAESLLRDADAAMYRAKEQGRDRWVVFDGAMRAGATRRLESEHALRRALERNELVPYYQPIVELTSGQVVGVEALARWHDPARGVVMPGDFIPMAEETGLIVSLGAAIMRQACADVAAWQRDESTAGPLSVSVNLWPAQLLAPGCPIWSKRRSPLQGLPAASLCLEITESVLLDDADCVLACCAVRALG